MLLFLNIISYTLNWFKFTVLALWMCSSKSFYELFYCFKICFVQLVSCINSVSKVFILVLFLVRTGKVTKILKIAKLDNIFYHSKVTLTSIDNVVGFDKLEKHNKLQRTTTTHRQTTLPPYLCSRLCIQKTTRKLGTLRRFYLFSFLAFYLVCV